MRPFVIAAALAVAGAGVFALSAPQEPPAAWKRLEGAWVRTDPDGAGSFGGLGASIPPARLKAGVAAGGRGGRGGGAPGGGRGPGRGAPASADTTPHKEGDPYIAVAQPCGGGGAGRSNGALLINPDSGGVHLVVSKDEIIFAGERGGVRHIHMDGRPHPSPWPPSGAGHSVGRFEGEVLVVDTVGLLPGAVPGGGMRSAATHLVERFQVADGGKTMTITYSWEDPVIYEAPHVYRYLFDRAPGDPPYAMEEWCDASDPVEKQSIVPPKQIK